MELPDVPLFRGLTADEAEAAVTALRMRRRAFAKGEILLEAGQRAPALGVVLAGRVHMEHLDVWGSKTLLGQAGPGDLFAETYACLPDEPLRVSVVAAENGEALFLETGQLLQCGCEPWRWKLTQNLLRIAARKNLGLAQRSLYTAPKTIRGRITAYFSVLARQNGSLRFTLPFDRQQLADLLWTAAGKPQPASTALFTDISAEAADSQKAARWCVEQGLLKDTGSTFKPDKHTFRPQVIKAWNDLQAKLNPQK